MFIVTEYGKARYYSKYNMGSGAEMLINIAHPDFRDELIKDTRKAENMDQDQ